VSHNWVSNVSNVPLCKVNASLPVQRWPVLMDLALTRLLQTFIKERDSFIGLLGGFSVCLKHFLSVILTKAGQGDLVPWSDGPYQGLCSTIVVRFVLKPTERLYFG
jgi:hypothetical protein